jgi:hypothetical protein
MTFRVPVFLVLAIALQGIASSARSDQLASYRTVQGHDIRLMNDPCDARNGKARRAHKRIGGKELAGCWQVNAQGNPVVRWSDGQLDELSESRVRLAPRYAAMLEEVEPGASGDETPSGPGVWRPEWCSRATLPHERLICRDRELLAGNQTLSGLWQAYRTQPDLGEIELGRVRSEYFNRLKACGAQKSCLARAQAAQISFYRKALGR